MGKLKNQNIEAAAVFINPYDLVEWNKNPRFNDGAVEKIAGSISKFGFSVLWALCYRALCGRLMVKCFANVV